jgi:hypothetical protein
VNTAPFFACQTLPADSILRSIEDIQVHGVPTGADDQILQRVGLLQALNQSKGIMAKSRRFWKAQTPKTCEIGSQ